MDNELIKSFKDFGKEFSKLWKKIIKLVDNSVKSVRGKTIYSIFLGIISTVLIFNLGFVISQSLVTGVEEIVLSLNKTDSFTMTEVNSNVKYSSVLSANYSYRNWNNVSCNKQMMFVDGYNIYTADGYNTSGKFVLTKYNSKFNKKSTKTFDYASYGKSIYKKAGWSTDTTFLYGNFAVSDNYYYLVLVGPDYGSRAKDTDMLSAPAVRILKMNKSLKVVDYYDMSYTSMGATRPGGWSDLAIAVSPDGSELSFSTGFDGFYDSYASADGTGSGSRHQIGLQLIINTKDMTLKKKSPVWATHTLGQHVIYDGEDRIFIDAADASPCHGILLSKVSGDNFTITQNKQVTTPIISSYVYMNLNIGGVAASSNNYLTVYNTMDETLTSSLGATHNSVSTEIRDIRVLVTPKNRVSSGTVITLHDYLSTKETSFIKNDDTRSGGEPRIVDIGNDNFLVMWYETIWNSSESFSYQTTCYMVIDGDGNVVQEVIKDNTMWLNTYVTPVFNSKNNTVYWFNDSATGIRTFYELKVRV